VTPHQALTAHFPTRHGGNGCQWWGIRTVPLCGLSPNIGFDKSSRVSLHPSEFLACSCRQVLAPWPGPMIRMVWRLERKDAETCRRRRRRRRRGTQPGRQLQLGIGQDHDGFNISPLLGTCCQNPLHPSHSLVMCVASLATKSQAKYELGSKKSDARCRSEKDVSAMRISYIEFPGFSGAVPALLSTGSSKRPFISSSIRKWLLIL